MAWSTQGPLTCLAPAGLPATLIEDHREHVTVQLPLLCSWLGLAGTVQTRLQLLWKVEMDLVLVIVRKKEARRTTKEELRPSPPISLACLVVEGAASIFISMRLSLTGLDPVESCLVEGGMPGLETGLGEGGGLDAQLSAMNASQMTSTHLNQVENDDDLGLFDELYGEPVRQRNRTSYISDDEEEEEEHENTVQEVRVPTSTTPRPILSMEKPDNEGEAQPPCDNDDDASSTGTPPPLIDNKLTARGNDAGDEIEISDGETDGKETGNEA